MRRKLAPTNRWFVADRRQREINYDDPKSSIFTVCTTLTTAFKQLLDHSEQLLNRSEQLLIAFSPNRMVHTLIFEFFAPSFPFIAEPQQIIYSRWMNFNFYMYYYYILQNFSKKMDLYFYFGKCEQLENCWLILKSQPLCRISILCTYYLFNIF